MLVGRFSWRSRVATTPLPHLKCGEGSSEPPSLWLRDTTLGVTRRSSVLTPRGPARRSRADAHTFSACPELLMCTSDMQKEVVGKLRGVKRTSSVPKALICPRSDARCCASRVPYSYKCVPTLSRPRLTCWRRRNMCALACSAEQKRASWLFSSFFSRGLVLFILHIF